MSKRFEGVINVDVRDSTPEFESYEQPAAPEGALTLERPEKAEL